MTKESIIAVMSLNDEGCSYLIHETHMALLTNDPKTTSEATTKLAITLGNEMLDHYKRSWDGALSYDEHLVESMRQEINRAANLNDVHKAFEHFNNMVKSKASINVEYRKLFSAE